LLDDELRFRGAFASNRVNRLLKLDLEVLRFCCSCVELHLEGAILLLQVDHHATNGLEVIISPSELIS
jgi:hypothetical protein